MAKSLFSKPWLQCLLFLIGGGLISMILKFEVLWDFANYHYYNAWVFFQDNHSDVLSLAGFHSFFNPIIDIPLYLLIESFNDYPNLVYFVQGLSFGFLAFVFFQIEKFYFDEAASIVSALIIGVTGYAVFFQIGTSSNEVQITVFIMLSFLFLVKGIFIDNSKIKCLILSAGFLAGIAFGLKYTAVIYCVSIFLSIVVISLPNISKVEALSLFILGGSVGFLCVNGFWMWRLWDEFHNPFFPFLNKIFHSEYWGNNNLSDRRFIPRTIWEFLILPFDYLRNGNSFLVWDYRLGFCWIALIALFFSKKRIDTKFKFLICFWIISYVIWVLFFAISRYLIAVELIGAVILVKTATMLRPQNEKYFGYYEWLICILFFILLINPLISGKYGCRNCQLDEKKFNKFMEIEAGIQIPDNALLMFYYDPGAALLPYFSREGKKLKGVYIKKQNYKEFCNGVDPFEEIDFWIKQKQKIITEHKGISVGVIAYQDDKTVSDIIKKEELLKGMVCKKFKSNIMPWYHFCVDADKQSEIFR